MQYRVQVSLLRALCNDLLYMNSFGCLQLRYVFLYFTQLSFDGLCSKLVYTLSILLFDRCLAFAQ